MLFHVTARHSVNDCNLYNEDIKKALQEFLPAIPALCEELNVKIHYAVTGAPDHVFFLLIEADEYSSLCTLLSAVPMKQEFDVKPVRLLGIQQPCQPKQTSK